MTGKNLISRRLAMVSGIGMLCGLANRTNAASPILIGQSAVLTGPFSPNSLSFIEGQNAFFSRINAAGGISGRPLQVITYDDSYQNNLAAENAEKLIGQHGVLCLFGAMGAGVGGAIANVALKHKSFVFGGLTGASALRGNDMPIYHVRASYADEARHTAEHLSVLGIKRIAIASSNDAYGNGLEKDAQQAFERFGIPAQLVLQFNPLKEDLTLEAKQIEAARVQVVYVVAAGLPAVRIMSAVSNIPACPKIYSNSVASSFMLHGKLGPRSKGIVLSQVVPSFWKKSIPIAVEYNASLNILNPKASASYLGFEGYITAKVLCEYLKSIKSEITTDALRASIENYGPIDIGGYRVAFSLKEKNGSKFGEIVMLGEGGAFIR